MKNALATMIGLAALTLPAFAQSTSPLTPATTAVAPQVEIPEGAFEITLPNLGTFIDVVPADGEHEIALPENVHVILGRIGPNVRLHPTREKATRRTVEIRSPRETVEIDVDGEELELHRVSIISADSAALLLEAGELPGDLRREVIIVRAHRGRPNAKERTQRRVETGETTDAATVPTTAGNTMPDVSEYSRPEPPLPSAVEILAAANAGYSLANATPNPVSTNASISFTLPRAGQTKLAVFDNAGRVVATLADGDLEAGTHTRTFDASGLPAGLYLYRLSSGSYAETKTMTVVR